MKYVYFTADMTFSSPQCLLQFRSVCIWLVGVFLPSPDSLLLMSFPLPSPEIQTDFPPYDKKKCIFLISYVAVARSLLHSVLGLGLFVYILCIVLEGSYNGRHLQFSSVLIVVA